MSLAQMNLDNTLGAAFCGLAVSSTIFGIFSTQAYMYFGRYPHDKLEYKFLVLTMILLETLDEALISYTVYYYAITNYNKPFVLLFGPVLWSIIIQLMLGAMVGAIVKTCSAMRVWRFSNNNIPLIVVLLLLILAQLGFAVSYTVKAFYLDKLADLDKLMLLATFTLGLGVITDITIAVALCYYLRKLRTGYARSDTLVNTLMRYAINTGILTSFVSLSTLISYNVAPHNFIFVGFYFVLCNMYGISFMATLNTRRSIKGKGADNEQQKFPPCDNIPANDTKPGPSSFGNDNQTESQIEVGAYHESLFFPDTSHTRDVLSSYSVAS